MATFKRVVQWSCSSVIEDEIHISFTIIMRSCKYTLVHLSFSLVKFREWFDLSCVQARYKQHLLIPILREEILRSTNSNLDRRRTNQCKKTLFKWILNMLRLRRCAEFLIRRIPIVTSSLSTYYTTYLRVADSLVSLRVTSHQDNQENA